MMCFKRCVPHYSGCSAINLTNAESCLLNWSLGRWCFLVVLMSGPVFKILSSQVTCHAWILPSQDVYFCAYMRGRGRMEWNYYIWIMRLPNISKTRQNAHNHFICINISISPQWELLYHHISVSQAQFVLFFVQNVLMKSSCNDWLSNTHLFQFYNFNIFSLQSLLQQNATFSK